MTKSKKLQKNSTSSLGELLTKVGTSSIYKRGRFFYASNYDGTFICRDLSTAIDLGKKLHSWAISPNL